MLMQWLDPWAALAVNVLSLDTCCGLNLHGLLSVWYLIGQTASYMLSNALSCLATNIKQTCLNGSHWQTALTRTLCKPTLSSMKLVLAQPTAASHVSGPCGTLLQDACTAATNLTHWSPLPLASPGQESS